MGSPSRNVQYHPPRLSEDRLNLPQPHSPSLPTHCSGKSGMRPLHLPGPETVGMIFLQFLASSEQVIQTGLVQRGAVAAIRHPPVAHEHPVEVGPENRGGIVEPATGANGVDRRLRGNERPQPVADGTHPPPGFIRRDHRRVADLLAQRRVGRRGVAGRAVQQVSEAARRHLQAERGPQHVGDLRQRYAHLGVQLDDQRHDAGAQLRTGRAQRIRGLQRVAALHAPLTLRAVTHLDVKAAHDRAHRGDFFLILRCHAVTSIAPPQSGHAAGTGAACVSSTWAGRRRHACRP